MKDWKELAIDILTWHPNPALSSEDRQEFATYLRGVFAAAERVEQLERFNALRDSL